MNQRHAAAILVSMLAAPCLAQTASFTDDFSSYPNKNVCLADGSSFGPWTIAFSGYGCVKIGTDGTTSWLDQSPAVSASPSETHASLTLGPSFSGSMVYNANVRTVTQLRQGSAPNPWEVGWLLWNYSDNSHFYYFQAKPNGWELGKEDPAYPGSQRFLATGPTPAFPIGVWYSVQITQNGNAISVAVNGQAIVNFTDSERPYVAGRIGLYNEDSHVEFTKISVVPSAASTAAPVSTPTSSVSSTPPAAATSAAPVASSNPSGVSPAAAVPPAASTSLSGVKSVAAPSKPAAGRKS